MIKIDAKRNKIILQVSKDEIKKRRKNGSNLT
jgi:dihydroxyacid dehydratase/phosphogluconate dehydratase